MGGVAVAAHLAISANLLSGQLKRISNTAQLRGIATASVSAAWRTRLESSGPISRPPT